MTVFISGAGRGLGRFLAMSFYARGWKVYAASRQPSIDVYGPGFDLSRLVLGPLDVADYQSCEHAISDCLARCGPVDVLINNASGFSGGKPIGKYSAKELELEVRATLLGAVNLSNVFVAAHPDSRAKRHIIFMASTAGLRAESGNGDYCVYAAAKAGIIRFSECIRDSLRAKNIFPHTLIPSGIRETNFEAESAVSFDDILGSIDFLIAADDNRFVQNLILRAERSSSTPPTGG